MLVIQCLDAIDLPVILMINILYFLSDNDLYNALYSWRAFLWLASSSLTGSSSGTDIVLNQLKKKRTQDFEAKDLQNVIICTQK